jgi:hypothetical protein
MRLVHGGRPVGEALDVATSVVEERHQLVQRKLAAPPLPGTRLLIRGVRHDAIVRWPDRTTSNGPTKMIRSGEGKGARGLV